MILIIKKFFSKKYLEYVIVGITIIFALFLGLKGLGNNSYWDDEAETGIFAKNFLATGTFTGWDGRNLYTYRNGALLDDNLRSINPPLQYIVAAIGFKLFGFSNFAGRLPFVFFGIASLIILWFLLLKEFPNEPAIRLYTMVLTGLSTPFLLHIRQCRYYALCLFFGLAAYYLYRRAMKDDKLYWYLLSALTFVMLFYSNFLACIAMLGSVFIIQIVFYEKFFIFRKHLKIGWSIVLFVLLTVPYAFHYHIWQRYDYRIEDLSFTTKAIFLSIKELCGLDLLGFLPFWEMLFRTFLIPAKIVMILFRSFINLDNYEYLPLGVIIIGIFVIYYFQKKQKLPKIIYEWAILILGYVLTLSVVAAYCGGRGEPKYMIILLPFCSSIIGTFLYYFHRIRYGRLISIFFLIILLSSNVLSFYPRKMWLLPALLKEFFNGYQTYIDVTVSYLAKHAKRNDIIYCNDECNLNVFQFYLGNKIIVQGRLRNTSQLHKDTLNWYFGHKYTHLHAEKLSLIDGLKYIDESYPDWIVIFQNNKQLVPEILKYFSRGPFVYGINIKEQQYIILQGSDNLSDPNIRAHNFGSITNFAPQVVEVSIFRKTERKHPDKNNNI
ncbi:MAG: glycosyltransferase family 39 protein [Elusimicrobia bacterium]|nr:glycosyltransferase family 39 protein [Elusimicrobiota bacterium]